MNTVRQVARRAAHRRTLRRFVSALSPSLGAAFGAAFVLVLLDRLFALGSLREAPWWLAPAAAGALGLAGAALWAMLDPRDTLAAAGEVDANLRLHDRLATALLLADRAEDDPFVGLTVRQAEQAASNVRLALAVPVRITPRWWSWTALAALTLIASLFLPRADLLGRDESAQRLVALASERERAREQIEQAAQHAEELVEQASPDPALADPVRTEQLEVLDRLRDQLAGGSTESDAARSEAARALDELAEDFAREAEDAQARQDAVRELLGSLEHTDPVSGEDAATPAAHDAASALAAEELAESLRRGDLESAANQLETLQQRAAQMPAEQREQTAQQLRRLAEAIEKAAQQQQAEQQRAQEEQDESLRNRGLDGQSIRELRQERDEQRIREHLEKQGMDEDVARRLADDLAEQNRRREAEQKATEDARQISEGLKQSAEELRQDQPPPDEPRQETNPAAQEPQSTSKDGAAQPRPGAQKPGDPQPSSPQKDGAPGESGKHAEPAGRSRDPSDPPGPQMPSPTTSPQGIQKSDEQKYGEQDNPRNDMPGDGTPSSPSNQPGTREGKPEPSKQEQGQQDATSPQPDDSGRPGPGESPKPGSAPGADPGAPPPGQPRPDGRPSESPAGSPGSPEGKPAPTDASGGGQPVSNNRQPSPGAPGQGRPDPSSPATPGGASQPGSPGSKPGESHQRNEQSGSEGESSPGGTGSGAGKGGMSGLKEKLKDMARRGAAADQRRQSAEELRREAERLLSEMSPQEREELKRWAMAQLKEQGGDVSGDRVNASGAPDDPGTSGDSGFRTETVDARSRGSDGKVVAEINDPRRRNEDRAHRDQRAVSRTEVREQLREAIQSTERAMEDRVVPTRYRNVKEYFRKALERAEAEKASQDAAPAAEPPGTEDARDVEKKPSEDKKP